MKRAIILAGGPLEDCDQVEISREEGDFVVACDAGYLAAERLGILPDLAVGDFDSYCGQINPAVPVYTVPAQKDDTDTMLGIRIALERGYREFLLTGALGGRLDHTLANLQALVFLREQGAHGTILSNRHIVLAVRNETACIPKRPGWYLSVFAAGGRCEGVTLEGLQYPLQDAVMTAGLPVGVSNAFTDAAQAKVTVRDGALWVVLAKEGTAPQR